MSAAKTRTEHDLIGNKEVPADAYYGVQTARGLENFNISGLQLRLYPNIIKALGMVKLAAARANFDCGQFSQEILRGMEGACQELIAGKLHDEFRLDMFQGGAGTSTNMNANEVIANRAARSRPTTPTRRRCTSAWRSAIASSSPRSTSSSRRSPPRARNFRRSSRWAAPSSRTPCR
jgi:fumarate hydratase class II